MTEKTFSIPLVTVDIVLFGVPQMGQFSLSLNLNSMLFGVPYLDLLTLIFGKFSLGQSSSGKYTVTFQHQVLMTHQQRAYACVRVRTYVCAPMCACVPVVLEAVQWEPRLPSLERTE